MSFKQKAKEIHDAGVAQRGNFTPEGAPLRVYRYWLNETESARGVRIRSGSQRENFCHFWRVVAIWAPLMFLHNKAEQHANAVLVTLGIVAVWAVVTFSILFHSFAAVVLTLVVFFAALAYVIFGFVVGMALAMTPAERVEADLVTNERVLRYGGLVAFPGTVVGWTLIKVAQFYMEYLAEYTKQILLGLLLVAAVVGLVLTGVSAGGLLLLEFLVGTIGLALLAGALVFGGALLGEFISGRRALARQRAAERAPAPIEVVATSNEPKHSKFFTGLGDFLILLAQVIRTKKWKICPLVEIEETT